MRMFPVITSQPKDRVESWYSIAQNHREVQRVNFVLPDSDHKAFSCGAINIEMHAGTLVARGHMLCERMKPVRDWLWRRDERANGEVAENVDGRHRLAN